MFFLSNLLVWATMASAITLEKDVMDKDEVRLDLLHHRAADRPDLNALQRGFSAHRRLEAMGLCTNRLQETVSQVQSDAIGILSLINQVVSSTNQLLMKKRT